MRAIQTNFDFVGRIRLWAIISGLLVGLSILVVLVLRLNLSIDFVGGTSFTPIVNYPEVAILGMCRSALQPVVKDGQIVPRLMLPLSLTYDHRVIDGADGARFTARLTQLFSDPMRLLMES